MGNLFEVRDYHYDGDMAAYRAWWVDAIEIIGSRFDVQGVWFDSGIPTRINGSDPMDPVHGAPNVTWVIRWDDMDAREAEWDRLWSDPDWKACWDDHPGFERYLHMSVRFMEAI